MKAWATLSALALVAVVHAGRVEFNVLVSGDLAGTAVFSQSILKDGSLLQSLKMKMKLNGAETTYSTVQRFSRSGRPVSEVREEQSIAGSKVVAVSYRATQVVVKTTGGGASVVKNYKIPAGSLVTPSVFWVVRGTPMKGAAEQRLFFDSETTKFSTKTTTYLGVTPLRVADRNVKAHFIKQGPNSLYLDNRGQPYELDLVSPEVTIRLTRKMPSLGARVKG